MARLPAPSAANCSGNTSVTTDNIIILAAPVSRNIENSRLLTHYTNSSLCASAQVRVTVSRPIVLTAGPHNHWVVRMPISVLIDGVTQVLNADVPSFGILTSEVSGRADGILFWDDIFVVGPGKRLEVYGSTVLEPVSGVLVDVFNEVSLGTGTIIVSE